MLYFLLTDATKFYFLYLMVTINTTIMKKIYIIFTLFFTSFIFSQSSGSTCVQANIFCGATGITFANTIGGGNAGPLACLGTTPNASWFYLPISGSGPIALNISQASSSGAGIDVDYAVYGPFTDTVTPCVDGLIPSNLVGCSYSAASVENTTITNAQAGQYYLMITTNFSNQPGNITIAQTNTGVPGAGVISCSDLRLRLNSFLDLNNNGTKDTTEPNFPLGQFQYEVNNDGITHNLVAPAGIYNLFETNPANSYDVGFTIDPQYATNYSTSASYSNVYTGSLYNFPVTVTTPYNDLSITTIPTMSPRPGFIYENKIVYSNLGNQTIAAGTLAFNKDANVSITSISQTGTTATTTGFTYNFTNLLPFETRTFSVFMQVPTIPTVTDGQVLTNTSSITAVTGETILENNTSSVAQIIVNSYDPNDKVESHGGKILYSSFTANDYLYYTIRFENEGTASAINVKVNDVLDAKLDETSLRMISASHPYALDRVGNALSWRFDNIQLPVSIANSSVGKGYISFKIKPKPNYAVGDIIPNSASIYFDFNPAIVTNTFTTEFVSVLSTSQFENADFVFYPNPAADFITISTKDLAGSITKTTVFDVMGKQIITNIPSGDKSTEVLDITSLTTGIYFIEVTTSNNLKVVKKLLVK